MLKKIFRILFIPIGAAIGYWVWKLVELIIRQNELQFLGWAATACALFSIALFAVIGFFAGKPASSAISQLLSKIIKRAREMPAKGDVSCLRRIAFWIFSSIFGLSDL